MAKKNEARMTVYSNSDDFKRRAKKAELAGKVDAISASANPEFKNQQIREQLARRIEAACKLAEAQERIAKRRVEFIAELVASGVDITSLERMDAQKGAKLERCVEGCCEVIELPE